MWLDIELDNIKPLYQINQYGEIKNKKTGKKLKHKITKHGYHEVGLLRYDNTVKWIRVHRLILLTFPFVSYTFQNEGNHKDCNKDNNTVDNLEWCTPEENLEHARQMDKLSYKGETNPQSKYTDDFVRQICDLLLLELNIDEIITELNVENTNSIRKLISRIRSGDGWTFISDGYVWSVPLKGGNNLKNKKYVKEVIHLLNENKSTIEIMNMMEWNNFTGAMRRNKLEFINRLRHKETFKNLFI
jgi:hypothetical protein